MTEDVKFEAWLAMGQGNGWIAPAACETHGDPCVYVLHGWTPGWTPPPEHQPLPADLAGDDVSCPSCGVPDSMVLGEYMFTMRSIGRFKPGQVIVDTMGWSEDLPEDSHGEHVLCQSCGDTWAVPESGLDYE